MRNRSVFGCRPSRSAALPMPLIRHRQSWRTSSMCARSTDISVVPTSVWMSGASRLPSSSVSALPDGVNQRTLNDVLELADVARPRIALQRLQHLGWNGGDVTLEDALPLADDGPHEGGDVLPPFAQGRQPDGEHVQPVVQVGPELPFRHRSSRGPCASRQRFGHRRRGFATTRRVRRPLPGGRAATSAEGPSADRRSRRGRASRDAPARTAPVAERWRP